MKCIVTVATRPRDKQNLMRLLGQIADKELVLAYSDKLPPNSPAHEDVPYGFKIAAIEQAILHGADRLMWMDASIVVLRPLKPLWDLIEQQGYWFSRNYGYNNGQFCNDQALSVMRMSRDEAFSVPQIVGGCFGLDLRNLTAREFMKHWRYLMEMGCFKGDRGDLSGTGDMTKFVGHRNDQSCASDVVFRLGMKLTDPPRYFAEQGAPQSEETILTVER